MALSDYRLCDVCGRKTFYDSSLNIEWMDEQTEKDPPREPVRYCNPDNEHSGILIDWLGDWAVICNTCSKTHKTVIVEREGNT